MIKAMAWLSAGLAVAAAAWAQAPLTVAPAGRELILTGYTRARAVQAVAAEVGGKVVRVHYDVGQIVGERPFLKIDPIFVDFQIEQVGWRLEQVTVAQKRHHSRVAFLEKEFARIDALFQDQVAPLARWEAVAEELAQARLALQATEAEIGTLDAQLRELKERRRRHSVSAPEGWTVVARHVEPGEIIAAGAPLARVADFRQLVVPLFVSADELAALQSREIMPVSVAGQPAAARLNWVNPAFDERTRKTAIELILADYDGEHRGGLPVALTLALAAEGLMVPRAAVADRHGNPYVRRAADGRMVPVFVTGEGDDYLIIADHEALAPGMALAPRPDDR